MGYTIHWEPIHPISQGVWDTFIRRALHLIKKRRTGKVQLETKMWDPKNYMKNIKVKNILMFSGTKEEGSETFTVCKDPNELSEYTWVKTNRNPYTFDVYVCLILMYDLGLLRRFSSDDMNFMYPEALAYVKKNFALKDSYEKLENMGYEPNNDEEERKTASPPKMKERKPRKKTVKSARRARVKTMKH
jgi:hypothetical protein